MKYWLFAVALVCSTNALAQDNPTHDPGEWGKLQIEARDSERRGDRAGAIALQLKAISAAERNPADALLVVSSLVAISRMQLQIGKLDEAQATGQKGLALQRTLNAAHPNTARLLILLGQIAARQGKDADAVVHFMQAAESLASRPGSEDILAGIHRNLGELHHKARRFTDAEKAYLEASTQLARATTTAPSEVALVQARLGTVYFDLRRYIEAEQHLARALTLMTQQNPAGSSVAADTAYNLGMALVWQRKWIEAEPVLRRARAALVRHQGADHALVYQADIGIARALLGTHRAADALRLYEATLARGEKLWGVDDMQVGDVLTGIGEVHLTQRRFDEAVSAYSRAMDIQSKSSTPRNGAGVRMGMSSVYRGKGDDAKADEFYAAALDWMERYDPRTKAKSMETLAAGNIGLGHLKQAEDLLNRSLATWEQLVGSESPEIVPALTQLATVQMRRQQWPQALAVLGRSHAIAEKQYGLDHPLVAMRLVELALVKQRNDPSSDALALAEGAFKTLDRFPDYELLNATMQEYMAIVLRVTGQREKAEPLLQKVLGMRTRRLSANHQLVASTHHHLAAVLHDMKRFELAERHYLEAIRIREAGAQPVLTGITVLELAGLSFNQCRYVDADKHYARAREILEKQLGTRHPFVASSIEGVALGHWTKGDFAEAESLLGRALEIREGAFGKEHIGVLPTMRLLTMLKMEQEQWSQAVPLQLRALGIAEKALGAEHMAVAEPIGLLGVLYLRQDETQTARTLFQRAMNVVEKTHGKEDRHMASLLLGMAQVDAKQSDYAAAHSAIVRAIAITEKSPGVDEADLVVPLNALTSVLRQQGKFTEAEAVHRRAASIVEKAMGSNHPLLAATLGELAALRFASNDWADGRAVFKRAREIWEKAQGGAGTGLLRSHLVCPRHPLEELKGDL